RSPSSWQTSCCKCRSSSVRVPPHARPRQSQPKKGGLRTDEQRSPPPGDYFDDFAGLAALPFSSTTIISNGVSPVFSGRWVTLVAYCVWPALTEKLSFLPSGKVNVPLPSVRNTAPSAGWLCMTDFSCGP